MVLTCIRVQTYRLTMILATFDLTLLAQSPVVPAEEPQSKYLVMGVQPLVV